jgi:hypothetical protein
VKAPPVPKIQQPWRPSEWVVFVDVRLDLPNVRLHECFQVIRNAMESAGIFWIVGDEKKVMHKPYTSG